jgi:hypothetical protein
MVIQLETTQKGVLGSFSVFVAFKMMQKHPIHPHKAIKLKIGVRAGGKA